MYHALLDAWVTETASAWSSRHKVRANIEEKLDMMAPEEAIQTTWGQSVSSAQWEQMKAGAKGQPPGANNHG